MLDTKHFPEEDSRTLVGWREWLDSRTGCFSLLREALNEPIPGGAKWAYVFGSGLLYLFLSQLITGVFLALYYVPSSDHAHTTVSYISKVVSAGLFLRSIHAYGATAIIVVLFLHISQTLLYGSYKGRRELLWLSGCFLLALMLGMAFTGYLLPWDKKAYFASAVGTNIISEIPVIGMPLQELLRGGSQMGTLTISRFFVLHVFVLPGLLIAFISTHLFLFRKAGPAGPFKEDPIEPRLPAQKFYPRQLVMDMGAALLIIVALGLAAYFIPVRLGPEAVASDTTYIPRPEWYYVPIFEWLRILGGKWSLLGGIVLPGILAVVFAAIPFLDRGRERRPWRRPIVIGGFAMFALCYAALGAISYRFDATNPIVAAQLAHQQQAEVDFMRKPFELQQSKQQSLGRGTDAPAYPAIAKGAAIFAAGPCSGCHGSKGEGTASAPPLVGIGQKYSPDRLAYLLHHRTPQMIDGGMPSVDLNQADTEALVAYLRSLK
ncbi:MAG TPA: cytochrome b N-terminal domain-containing protein [Terracidiphilus sp.]